MDNTKKPISYLPQILKLKQYLANNNLEESNQIIEELELTIKQERIHILEEFLLLMMSRLMYIQGEPEMMEFTYNDILKYLTEIQSHNQLDENSYYISLDGWQKHFEAVLKRASDVGREACLNLEVRRWTGEFDQAALWKEVQKVLAYTYSLSPTEIDQHLRSYWSGYRFLEY